MEEPTSDVLDVDGNGGCGCDGSGGALGPGTGFTLSGSKAGTKYNNSFVGITSYLLQNVLEIYLVSTFKKTYHLSLHENK